MVSSNVMREIYLEKVTINISVGNDKNAMERAKKLLIKLTNRTPSYVMARKRIATWSIRPGLPIGYKVTLRGEEGEKFLKWILESKGNKVSKSSIDKYGNFSVGVHEYLDLINMKYDAEIGVMGFEVAVNFARKGIRVKNRRLKKGKIPERHRVTKKEVIDYLSNKMKVEVI